VAGIHSCVHDSHVQTYKKKNNALGNDLLPGVVARLVVEGYYDDCSMGVSPGGPPVLLPPAKHSKASAPSSSILQHLKQF